MLARRISPFEGGRGDVSSQPPQKTSFLYLLISNHLTIILKKTWKKSAKKFAELKKRRTFAPANETISALARRNNTYIDIMLYSTKKDLKNRVKPEVNNLKIG